jgi:hypothetical protein
LTTNCLQYCTYSSSKFKLHQILRSLPKEIFGHCICLVIITHAKSPTLRIKAQVLFKCTVNCSNFEAFKKNPHHSSILVNTFFFIFNLCFVQNFYFKFKINAKNFLLRVKFFSRIMSKVSEFLADLKI